MIQTALSIPPPLVDPFEDDDEPSPPSRHPGGVP